MKKVLLCCAVLASTTCAWETPTAPTVDQLLAQTTVLITEPTDGAVLNTADLIVRGTYAPSSLTDDIWVFVWPAEAAGKGYHQSTNAGIG